MAAPNIAAFVNGRWQPWPARASGISASTDPGQERCPRPIPRQGAADRQHRQPVRLHASSSEGLETLWERYRDQGLSWCWASRATSLAARIRAATTRSPSVLPAQLRRELPDDGQDRGQRGGAHPLYQWLTREAPGCWAAPRSGGTHQFLVGRDGQVIRRYAPQDAPRKLSADIEQALACLPPRGRDDGGCPVFAASRPGGVRTMAGICHPERSSLRRAVACWRPWGDRAAGVRLAWAAPGAAAPFQHRRGAPFERPGDPGDVPAAAGAPRAGPCSGRWRSSPPPISPSSPAGPRPSSTTSPSPLATRPAAAETGCRTSAAAHLQGRLQGGGRGGCRQPVFVNRRIWLAAP